uniref:Uncharacterized protein n=1 Tax=Trichogramma kaykai TaxID=54128 RepID=A0ABD2WPM5_9HYME
MHTGFNRPALELDTLANRKLQSRGLLDGSIESTSTLSTIKTIQRAKIKRGERKESLQQQKLQGRWVDR